jgi:hypothetical protein
VWNTKPRLRLSTGLSTRPMEFRDLFRLFTRQYLRNEQSSDGRGDNIRRHSQKGNLAEELNNQEISISIDLNVFVYTIVQRLELASTRHEPAHPRRIWTGLGERSDTKETHSPILPYITSMLSEKPWMHASICCSACSMPASSSIQPLIPCSPYLGCKGKRYCINNSLQILFRVDVAALAAILNGLSTQMFYN